MRRQDEADYVEFVQATWPRLFRSAYAWCGDYHLAEDALQAALVKTYASWRKVSRAGSPEAYVRQVVLNQLRSWWRRKSSAERVSDDLDQGWTSSPEDRLLLSDEVWRGLATLPPRQRAVVVLRYFEDLSEQQIADLLGVRPGTVKSQAATALAKLRTTFAMSDPMSELVTHGEGR